jgi:hypothetical protein
MANLNEAVQLIRQGRKDEARHILEPLLKTNPQDIQTWFWYVETCSTPEQRIKTLEICLKVNPGNPQALQALRALQAKQGGTAPQDEIPDWARRPAAIQPLDSEPVIPQPTFPSTSAFTFDEQDEPEPVHAPAAEDSGGGWQQPRGESKPAFDWDALEKESFPVVEVTDVPAQHQPAPKSSPRGTSLPFYQVWWQAVSTQSVAGYASIFDDPEAGAGRAFEWVAYTSALVGLLQPLLFLTNPQMAELRAMPEFQEIISGANFILVLAVIGLVMAVVTPILSVIGLAFNGWFYNLLAILFGGKGTFGRTVYALASYLAPVSLANSILFIIPIVGPLLATPIVIYSIILNVRALMAAHDLPFGRALGVMLLPGLVFFVLCCLLGILFGPVLSNALRTSGY